MRLCVDLPPTHREWNTTLKGRMAFAYYME